MGVCRGRVGDGVQQETSMVWGPAWLSRAPVALPSSRLLRLLRLRLLSMEVMLEEEVVRERARRVIPADGTEKERRALIFHSRLHTDSEHCGNIQIPTCNHNRSAYHANGSINMETNQIKEMRNGNLLHESPLLKIIQESNTTAEYSNPTELT